MWLLLVHTNKKDIQLCYNVHQKGGGPSRTGEIPVPAVKVRNLGPQPGWSWWNSSTDG